jgi:hypothetical protein
MTGRISFKPQVKLMPKEPPLALNPTNPAAVQPPGLTGLVGVEPTVIDPELIGDAPTLVTSQNECPPPVPIRAVPVMRSTIPFEKVSSDPFGSGPVVRIS